MPSIFRDRMNLPYLHKHKLWDSFSIKLYEEFSRWSIHDASGSNSHHSIHPQYQHAKNSNIPTRAAATTIVVTQGNTKSRPRDDVLDTKTIILYLKGTRISPMSIYTYRDLPLSAFPGETVNHPAQNLVPECLYDSGSTWQDVRYALVLPAQTARRHSTRRPSYLRQVLPHPVAAKKKLS